VVRVPLEAPTIQAGLDSLNDGDTVWVARGPTYQEFLTALPIRFTMLGQFNDDSSALGLIELNATNLPIDDTTAVLTLPPLASATIENFSFRNEDRYGVRSRADSITLRNCRFESMSYGVRDVLDSIASVFTLDHCSFRSIAWYAVLTRPGNFLSATNCDFHGAGLDPGIPLVASNKMIIDSCSFESNIGRTLLSASRGPHSITNCVFGSVDMDSPAPLVRLRHGIIRFANNTFRNCTYYTHVLDINSNMGDSLEIVGNTFDRCRATSEGIMAFGVLTVETATEGLERGALIADNTFIECSGNRAVDDIVPSVYFPALITGNSFIRDSNNGLATIYAGNPVWQQTPLTLRNNVWDNCGYAFYLGATADARWNDWGEPTGPFHASYNPGGQGDTIDGPVPFIPWLGDTTSVVPSHPEVVSDLSVSVHPNPFNSTVTIEYALTREQDVKLEIFDVLGRNVETIFDHRQTAGVHGVLWQANEFTSGVYFARLSSPLSNPQTVKLLLLK